MPADPSPIVAPDTQSFDALTTPIAWCDAEGRVAGGNLAFARWLG